MRRRMIASDQFSARLRFEAILDHQRRPLLRRAGRGHSKVENAPVNNGSERRKSDENERKVMPVALLLCGVTFLYVQRSISSTFISLALEEGEWKGKGGKGGRGKTHMPLLVRV
jgi:hypothetical protein